MCPSHTAFVLVVSDFNEKAANPKQAFMICSRQMMPSAQLMFAEEMEGYERLGEREEEREKRSYGC